MKNKIVISLGIMLLTNFIIGCSSSKEEIIEDDLIPPTEMTSIEIVEGKVFYIQGFRLYVSSLDGVSQRLSGETDTLVGLAPYAATDKDIYSSDGTSSIRENFGVNNTGFPDEEAGYFVKEGQVRKLDAELNYPLIDISAATTLLPVDTVVVKALIHNTSILLVHPDENGDWVVTLTVDNNLIELSDSYFKDVIKSDDDNKLFIVASSDIFVYDYEIGQLTRFESKLPQVLFKLNGDVYYRNGRDYYMFSEISYSFESATLPENIDVINDVERYQGFDYAATSTGIWKIDLQNNLFQQIIVN